MSFDPKGLAAGLNPDDFELAKVLGTMISKVDKIAFGEQAIRGPVVLKTAPSPLGDNASYYQPAGDQDEVYLVSIPNLHVNLVELRDAYNLILPSVFGKVVETPSLCFALACHEVRHRVQYHQHRDMRFFVNKKQRSGWLLLNKVLEITWVWLKERKRIMYGRGEKRELIDRRTGDMEFDAQVVEWLAVACEWDDKSIETEAGFADLVKKIVFIQPD